MSNPIPLDLGEMIEDFFDSVTVIYRVDLIATQPGRCHQVIGYFHEYADAVVAKQEAKANDPTALVLIDSCLVQ